MTTAEANSFQAQLIGFASKASRIKVHCQSEESTKIYLVVPFLALLGYDASDPSIVVPEHDADLHPGGNRKVDFAIIQDGQPAIAIEVKKAGAGLGEARNQLRSYYNALPSARLGITTNGVLYEFFVDSEQPNIMDAEPFLTLDLEAAATGSINPDVLALLTVIRQESYDPTALVEQAFTSLLRQRLKTLLLQEFRSPSDEFCKNLLQQLDIKGVRANQIDQHFRPIIKRAMEDAIIVPVLQSLRQRPIEAATDAAAAGSNDNAETLNSRIVTTTTELEVLDYAKRRLAFLVNDEQEYSAVERVCCKDYIGKFSVYLDRERKGRLFDYITLGDGRHRFVFPDLDVDMIVSSFEEIDGPLLEVFSRKLREMRVAA